jgi:hypothetical protein
MVVQMLGKMIVVENFYGQHGCTDWVQWVKLPKRRNALVHSIQEWHHE